MNYIKHFTIGLVSLFTLENVEAMGAILKMLAEVVVIGGNIYGLIHTIISTKKKQSKHEPK